MRIEDLKLGFFFIKFGLSVGNISETINMPIEITVNNKETIIIIGY